jgi:hypothetical protein
MRHYCQCGYAQKNHELYDVKANLQGIQVGKIIRIKILAHYCTDCCKGESFDFKNANADLKGHVASAFTKDTVIRI